MTARAAILVYQCPAWKVKSGEMTSDWRHRPLSGHFCCLLLNCRVGTAEPAETHTVRGLTVAYSHAGARGQLKNAEEINAKFHKSQSKWFIRIITVDCGSPLLLSLATHRYFTSSAREVNVCHESGLVVLSRPAPYIPVPLGPVGGIRRRSASAPTSTVLHLAGSMVSRWRTAFQRDGHGTADHSRAGQWPSLV